ncbi:MAG: DUF4347 domain-containing protein [Cyanobacteria bacterium P01_G01_bin.19]
MSNIHNAKSRTLVIIDSQVDDVEFLIAEIQADANVLVLHPNLDGISQVNAALIAYPNLSSLHLISHGSPGCLKLGNTRLNLDTLRKNSRQLKLWSETLQQKDVLIYGCEVAQGKVGNSFLQHLHQLTKANIAASTLKVGNAAGRNNWDLTTYFGKVATPVIFSSNLQKSYRGNFAEVSFSIEPDVAIETEGAEVTFNFTLDEAPPPEGTVVILSSNEASSINRFVLGGFGEELEFTGIDGANENPLFFDVSQNLDFSALAVNIRAQNASITGELFNSPDDESLDGPGNPSIEDAADVAEEVTWTISEIAPEDVPSGLGTPGTVAAGASSDTITFADNPEQLNATSEPEISISSDITELFEDDGDVVTLTLSLSEAPPEGGVTVPIETGKEFALGDFDIFPPPPQASATGGSLIGGFSDNSGFNFLVTDQTATISLPIFDDPDRTENGAVTDPDGPLRNDDIGEEQTTFSIGVGEGYTVNPEAASVTLTLNECFLTGTRILTEVGYKKVEELAIGDIVKTAEGKLEPVKWIGYQTRQPNQIINPLRGNPILFKAGSLGNNLPERDLYTSPDHAILVEGLLINAGALVNDISIVKTKPTEPFCYWHVELENHSLLVAEGSAAESFYPNREDRLVYDNGAEYDELYPYGNSRLMLYPLDYPRISSKNKVPQYVRQKLIQIAEGLCVSPVTV